MYSNVLFTGKYVAQYTDIKRDYGGINVYFTPFLSERDWGRWYSVEQPISIVLGFGGVTSHMSDKKRKGVYVEVGIGILKLVPLVDVDIIYRADFHNKPLHSLNVMFNIL